MLRNKVQVKTRADRVCLLLTLILIVWFCQDLVFSESVPFFRDLSTYFYPIRYSLFESYRSGNLPLWDRHMAMGFPLLADFQSGALYPPHLFFLILPFFTAIRAIFVFHFLVAGTGAYCLCRSWKYPPYLSVVGSLLFAFGGTIVSLANLLNHFQTAVWLPWGILSWEKVLRSTAWKHFFVFTLILAVQFLAGSPELFALTMVLVLVDGLRIKLSNPGVSYPKVFSIFLSANVLVLLFVMIQLLPTVELFLESRRQQPIPPSEVLHWSLKPISLLNLVFLDKEIDFKNPVGLRLFFGRETPFFVSYYLGAICVFGISLWFCFSSVREKITALSLIVVSMSLALGIYTPIYPFLLQHTHFLGEFRFPEKFFFPVYGILLYMILEGLNRLLLQDGKTLKKPFIAIVTVGVVWVGLFLFLRFHVDVMARFVTAQTGKPLLSLANAEIVAAIMSNLERQVVLSLGFLVLIILALARTIRLSLYGVLMVSAVFVDLAWAHQGFLFPLSPRIVTSGQRIMRAPDLDPARLFYYPSMRNLHPSSLLADGQPSFTAATALSFQDLLPNSGIIYGFDYMQEIDALARRPYTEFLSFANQLEPAQQIRLLRAFNVGYLLSFRPLSPEGITFVARFPQFFSWLYKIDKPLPRTYIVNRISVEQGPERTFHRLLEPGFDPMQAVVLDHAVQINQKGRFEGFANIVSYENQTVRIHTAVNHSGILVLADSYYPGWKAYVDGREARILKANHFFRAVVLAEGEHVVEFRYEPLSFKIGFAVSLTTLCALVFVSGYVYFRGRGAGNR
jgi:membrane protein YfhO